MEKPILLIVDDEPNNLKLLNQILNKQYTIRIATNGREALERVRIDPMPDLILLDVMMPEVDGYQVCQTFKSIPATANIPVIFITAKNEIEDEAKGFEAGGSDYIIKPISPPLVQARVANHLALANRQRACEKIVEEKTAELNSTQKAAIAMLGEAGHYNDTDTGIHIWRMAAYARALAQEMGWPVERAQMIELAAPMHDMGKIGIPDKILKAPRKLTRDEWTVMKQHTIIGHSILSKSHTPLFNMASEIALYHHERWDGTGYPEKLSGKNIPKTARILTIVDVFDALTMKRPYKEPWPVEKAFAEITNSIETQFDPELVEAFMGVKSKILELKDKYEKKEINSPDGLFHL